MATRGDDDHESDHIHWASQLGPNDLDQQDDFSDHSGFSQQSQDVNHDQSDDPHTQQHNAASLSRPTLRNGRSVSASAKSEPNRPSGFFTRYSYRSGNHSPAHPSNPQARTSFFNVNAAGHSLASSLASLRDHTRSPIRSFYGGIGAEPHSNSPHKMYDDQTFEEEMNLAGSGGNGIRVWYESYTTIDWIHDAIKESSRLRKLRQIKGLRGILVNSWDGFQGWVIVTITGIITALIACCIVKSEAVLFDLKDGYCQRDWTLAKRFCCPFAQSDHPNQPNLGLTNLSSPAIWTYRTRFLTSSIPTPSDPSNGLLTGMGNRLLAGWAAPVAGSPMWHTLTPSLEHGVEKNDCPGWITWGEKLSSIGQDSWMADYGMYVMIAVIYASIASILTIYLTSSELYLSEKDPTATASYKAAKNTATATLNNSNDEQVSSESAALLPNTAGHGTNYLSAETSHGATPINTNDVRQPSLGRLANEFRAKQALASRKILYFATGSGISEVKCILSGFVIHGYLGFWTLFTKSVGLTLSVASGLSLGKEGPFVHIASCVGNIVCRIFPKYENNEGKRREMLSCACAAGVAVAFGAPVGGVLFSLEEVSYYFPSKVMFRSFFCAMVAGATLRALDPFGTGKIVLFQVTYDKDWHFSELLFFILIGIFGGIYGAYFTKLNIAWAKKVRAKTWMATHPILEVVMITVISVAFSFLNGYTRMGGVELIANLFAECHEHESLEGLCVSHPSQIRPLIAAIVWAMIVKGLLTIITFGIKLPAGIFIPTLAVGACFGRIVGLLVQYVQWTQPDLSFFGWCGADDSACIVPGVYAMVGAAATLSGVTRTTVSLAVIMFELTGTLTYSVPVMLSILVAKTIADAMEHKGIYDLVIEFSGLPYLDSKAEYIWNNVNVTDAMDTDVELISLDVENTVQSLRQKLQRLAFGSGYMDGGFPIVTREKPSNSYNPDENHHGKRSSLPTIGIKMVGYIAVSELEHALKTAVKQDPYTDQDSLVCSFKHLPYIRALESDAGEANIRDSTVLIPTDPLDLSRYIDKAPITVTIHSPLELVHQYFTRLGVRYLIVVDEKGLFRGIIFKKRYLKFLADLEESRH